MTTSQYTYILQLPKIIFRVSDYVIPIVFFFLQHVDSVLLLASI